MDRSRDLGVEDAFSADGVSIRWDHDSSIASLRYFDPAGSFAAALGEVLAGPLPDPLRACRRLVTTADVSAETHANGIRNPGSGLVLAWRSPTETLLLSADPGCFAAVGKIASARPDGCWVDQTGGILVLVVAGDRAADLLLRLGSTNAIPKPGEARTGRLAELSVTSLCTRPGEILLLVERVYARHLIGWIRETVADIA